jgi:hypothetical protein
MVRMDLDIFWSLSSSSSDESTLSESSPLIFFTKNCPAGASIDLFTAVLFIMVEDEGRESNSSQHHSYNKGIVPLVRQSKRSFFCD